MPKARKTYKEKLYAKYNLPCVEPMPPKMVRLFGPGTICVPAPLEVDEIMRGVPKGKLMTVNQIRATVAKRHGATVGCPMGCGIFINIAAHAAEEMAAEGRKDITPYWRTVKEGGKLNEKYPGGAISQAAKLEAEGMTIEAGRGKQPPHVKDYERYLVALPQ
jgi:alkylated DNA nucleotide flippase Atl1